MIVHALALPIRNHCVLIAKTIVTNSLVPVNDFLVNDFLHVFFQHNPQYNAEFPQSRPEQIP